MIGAGLGSGLGAVPPSTLPSTLVTASGVTPDELPSTLRDASAQNAVTAAPVRSLVPNAIPAVGAAAETDDEPAEGEATPDNPLGLTPEEEARVQELQRIDAEVRRHEQAHMNAGGQYAGQASYTYETGPDGGRYAVAGEVPIDTAPVPDDPQATIDKMEVVIRAALAPAEPSAQDLRVAAGARQTIASARSELRAEEREEFQARLSGEDDQGPGINDDAAEAPAVAPVDAGESTGSGELQSGVAGLVSSVYDTVGGLRGSGDQPANSFAV
ncbi:MAG: hypothetical protein KI792_01080 [Alphaproteobacteria bacterium]|nr:hypothetical protein [Alphaproteobacteria bacterium SS10]